VTTREKIELHKKLADIHHRERTTEHIRAAFMHFGAAKHQERCKQCQSQKAPNESSARAHEFSARAYGVSSSEWRKKMLELLSEDFAQLGK
jgi:hypothetical protein